VYNGVDDDCDGLIDEGTVPNGQPCILDYQCASGNCVDGFCSP
jgi:hypothetical protein